MSAPEGFLTRWSRLKRTAETPSQKAGPPPETGAEAGADAAAPVVDLSSLPSLDGITADTDLSGFMQPGVPAALRQAALRRAWAADPAIRDFRGLQENDWDFTNPDAVPGFGTFASREEVARAARALFAAAAEEPPRDATPPEAATGAGEGVDKDQDHAPAAPEPTPQSENETQQRAPDLINGTRRHGGALPT